MDYGGLYGISRNEKKKVGAISKRSLGYYA